jgi:hypothetical protein
MAKVLSSRGLFTDYLKELEKLAEYHSEVVFLEKAYRVHVNFMNGVYVGAGAPIANEWGTQLLARIKIEFKTIKRYIKKLKLAPEDTKQDSPPPPPSEEPAAEPSKAVAVVSESSPPATVPPTAESP